MLGGPTRGWRFKTVSPAVADPGALAPIGNCHSLALAWICGWTGEPRACAAKSNAAGACHWHCTEDDVQREVLTSVALQQH